jgi:transketolase
VTRELTQLKESILNAAFASREGHIPSALSILDILWVLYNGVMNINPSDPADDTRDRFLLSKGHAALGLYAVLADCGLIDPAELSDFCSFHSRLGGHPERTKIPFVEASTGSLGHGFPIAVGVAMGLKIRQNSARVYTLCGDGECNEGTIWEAAMLAAHHKLDNLCCIVDHNHSTDRALDIGNLEAKFAAFGWHAVTIDGHDHSAIRTALAAQCSGSSRPFAIIAKTVKGKGFQTMEGNPAWHHKSPTSDELADLVKELYAQ